MNSDRIFEEIETIANVSGKKDKEQLVAINGEFEEFRRVLSAAFNPYTTYGIQKVPGESSGDAEFDDETWGILEALKNRDITGNDALNVVTLEMERLSPSSAELLKRIIRKDLRAGFGASTINKVIKKLIPVFPYMRCSLPNKVKLNEWNWKDGIISQEKADGMFANVDHEKSGAVNITSRSGSPFPQEQLEDFIAEVRTRLAPNTQTHGEFLVAIDEVVQPREISNGIMNRILSGGEFNSDEKLIYQVWDQIPLSHVVSKGKYSVPYGERLLSIVKSLQSIDGKHISLIPTRVVYTLAEAYAHYGELLKQGKEGTIIKQKEASWRDGTSKGQVKLKLEVDVDLKVVAIQPGAKGKKNEGRAGALTCETSCGTLQVDVTVKNEAMRDNVDSNPDDWVGRVIVVRSNQVLTPSKSNALHSLFLPRMVEAEYRTDKDEADSLERVLDQFESAVQVA